MGIDQKLCSNKCPTKRIEIKNLKTEYSLIFEKSLIGIAYVKNSKFVRVNPFFSKLFGYVEPRDLKNKHLRLIYPTETDLVEHLEMITPIVLNGDTYEGRHIFQRKDGTIFWGSLNCNLIQKKNPDEGCIWILQDITLQKEHEQELERRVIARTYELEKMNDNLHNEIAYRKDVESQLKSRELQLMSLINATPDIIVFKDGEGKWLLANDSIKDMFHFKDDSEWYGKTDLEMAHGRDKIWHTSHMACHDTDRTVWEAKGLTRVQEFLTMDNGVIHPFDVVKVPLFNSDGSRRGIVILGRDVYSYKIVEKELRETEQRLNQILESVLTGVIIIDAETNKVDYMNQLATKITGYQKDDLVGKVCYETICPRLHGSCILDHFKTDEVSLASGFYRTNTGNLVPIIKNVRKLIIRGKQYNIESFLDVTELRQKEDIIHFKDKVLTSLIKSVDILLHAKDLEEALNSSLGLIGMTLNCDRVSVQRMRSFNPFVMDPLFEWCDSDTPCYNTSPLIEYLQMIESTDSMWIHQLVRGQIIKLHTRNLDVGVRGFFEEQQVKSELVCPLIIDTELWGFISFDYCKSDHEWSDTEISILETVAQTFGITIRRLRMEQGVKHSELKYKALFEDSFNAIILSDLDTARIIDCNNAASELLEYSPDEMTGKSIYDLVVDTVHPDMIQEREELITNGYVYREESTCLTRSKKTKYVEVMIKLIKYHGNQVVFTILRDITEIKELEQQLKERDDKLQESMTHEVFKFQQELNEITQDTYKNLEESAKLIQSVVDAESEGESDG